MDWQITLAWIAIGGAGAYILWRAVRTLRPSKTGCAGGCGCAKPAESKEPTPAAIIPPEQLVLRRETSRSPQ